MKSLTRANLYAAIPPLTALLVGIGLITDVQGAALAGLGAQAVTLGFACYYAATQKAPLTRTVLYGFLSAVGAAGVAWGAVTPVTVDLIIPAAMGVLGLLVAQSNTGNTGHDGIPDDNPARKA